ncbi:MAG: polyphosphate kinase 2 family protein [Gammaproteobacteria bacterium]|nr:polyphosphate kinase 2 family protein [Gammaproteobacteria bacterium]
MHHAADPGRTAAAAAGGGPVSLVRRRGTGRAVALERLPGLLRVPAGGRHRLRDADADRRFGWTEEQADPELLRMKARLGELQYQLYADGRFGLLVVLQAIDGGGKDSTIRHVLSAFNPQGCTVTAFKAPSADELRHDYLWRVHARVPRRGEVGVFNRSHYEDVLVVRVDSLVPRAVWQRRYAEINAFERQLTHAGICIVKIFLHISKEEQRQRFRERLEDPRKHWKFDPADLKKRAQWSEYRRAFEDALQHCSTAEAPWHVVPANRKWLRDLAVARILLDAFEGMPLRWPKPDYDPKRIRLE